MKLIFHIFIFSFLFIIPVPVASASELQDSIIYYNLTIDELFHLGLEKSLRIRESKLQVQVENEQLKTAKRNRLPQIGIGLAAGYMGQPVLFTNGLANPTFPVAPRWKHDYEAQLVQPLFQGGEVYFNIEREKIEQKIAELSLEGEEQELKLEYLQRYLELFLMYKQLQVYDRNISAAEHRLRDIHNMYEEGLVTSNDEIRSKLQLTQYRLARRTVDDNIRVYSTTLDVLLDLDKTLIIMPDTTILEDLELPLQTLDYYLDHASENYPGMKIAREKDKLSKVHVSLSRSDYLPKLSLIANYGLIRPLSSSLEDKFYQNWDVGLSLTFNISSLYNNKLKEKKLGMLISKNALDEEWQNLYIKINENYSLHRQALDRIKTLELSVKEAQENYRIVNNRYMSQLSILTDLLDAESVLMDSELQLTGAQVNALFTYCQLLQVCGKL